MVMRSHPSIILPAKIDRLRWELSGLSLFKSVIQKSQSTEELLAVVDLFRHPVPERVCVLHDGILHGCLSHIVLEIWVVDGFQQAITEV